MKQEILKLRNDGKTYTEICELTGACKGTVSYYCRLNGLGDRRDGRGKQNKNIVEIDEYYKTHTLKETAAAFNTSISTIKLIVTTYKNKKLTPDERITNNYKHVKSFRKQNKDKAIAFGGGKCSVCGYDKCVDSFDFHHLDPNKKDFSISQNMNKAWHKIQAELEKCILLCANCHRELHFKLNHLNDVGD